MKKFYTLLLLSFLFFSCQKEIELKLTPGQELITIHKITPINDNFSSMKPSNLLENFLFNDIPALDFIENHNLEKEKLIELVNSKLNEFDNIKRNILLTSKEVTCEEVRDAMLDECDNGYCCTLAELCSVAVKIAYHYNKITGKCKSE